MTYEVLRKKSVESVTENLSMEGPFGVSHKLCVVPFLSSNAKYIFNILLSQSFQYTL